MVRSPRSRGKGNRRWPGRPGGARKKRPVGAWEHRAQHMVDSLGKLSHPVGAVEYAGIFGKTAEHTIYLFDQEMARLGVRYFAEFRERRFHAARFKIYVPEEYVSAVATVVARLRRV